MSIGAPDTGERGWGARWCAVLLPAVVASVGCGSAPLQAPGVPPRGQATLAVLSYNLNYGIAGDEATLDAIAAQRSDLVLLQETTPEWERALRARFGEEFAHMAFRHFQRERARQRGFVARITGVTLGPARLQPGRYVELEH
ncbi:MAG TPA: endonuclease/exonuclease/phosphatase family protein [Polyangiaceae bacterium]|nr:endonuclease/exonuclease/phosphatase family protein [Polyangiaceae bacterium]